MGLLRPVKDKLESFSEYFLGERKSSLSKKEVVKRYIQHIPSFSDQFAISEFCEKNHIFLLDDLKSVGSAIEIDGLQSEGLSEASLKKIYERLQDTFSYIVPCLRENPWVMQIYFNDEYAIDPILSHVTKGVDEKLKDDALTSEYLNNIESLLTTMVRSEGAFIDPKTDKPYRYRIRRIRIVLYRRLNNEEITIDEAIKEHLKVIKKAIKKLSSINIAARRLKGGLFYDWFVKWFNPSPSMTNGSVEKLLKKYPYPDDKPAGFNFIQNALFCNPISSIEDKYIQFDNMKHRCVFIDGLRGAPEIGVLSREKKQVNENHRYGLLDVLPEGTVYTIQVVFEHQDNLQAHLNKIESGIIGGGSEGQKAKANIALARDELFKGNKLYWSTQSLIFRAETVKELDEIEDELSEIFSYQAKMPLQPSRWDEHQVDSFMSMLPFNYDFQFARKYLSYENLMYASEIAAILPVYGRFTGEKKFSSLLFFNRLGEAVTLDLLHKDFISFNSHLVIFANSGAGKSVLILYFVFLLMATKNARIVLFEMGNSFDGLVELCKQKGKRTKQMLFSSDLNKSVAINPFADAYKALPNVKECYAPIDAENLAKDLEQYTTKHDQEASDEEKQCDAPKRNHLGELALVLRTMITQANEKEEEGFTLSDETLLVEVLCDAILKSIDDGHQQMLIEHVVQGFKRREANEQNPQKKQRAFEFADRLNGYLLNPSLRKQFNVESEPLEDFDLLHVDIGAIKDEHGKIALVMLSILPKIIALAEESQHTKRQTFLIIDESHLQFEIPSVVSYALLIAKVARKLGLWLMPATQNIKDMKSSKARRILSLCESKLVLGMDESEMNLLGTYVNLTEDDRETIREIGSSKGKYSEAVFLGSRYKGLFRVMLPRFLLALGLTEKDEKSERHELEKEHGVIGAARELAKKLEAVEVDEEENDAYFFD